MKQILLNIMGGILLLTACGPASSATQATSIYVVDTSIRTPSPVPTNTGTSILTETPVPSITPLPTIQTFTPTFDVSTIVTVTPAPKAECPKEDTGIILSFPIRTEENYFIDNSTQILQYLNQGGSVEKGAKLLSSAPPETIERVWLNDVTGDSTNELIFIDFTEDLRLHVFSCQTGQYHDFIPDIGYAPNTYSSALKIISRDLNANNVNDIIAMTSCSRAPLCSSFSILEWNGNDFADLIEPQEIFDGFLEVKITDVDSNGTMELVIEDNVRGDYAYFMGFPWRVSTHIYMWNGNKYALQNIRYAEPEYQFQAIQDADRYVLLKNYDLSLNLYDVAITDNNLLPYSRELSEHMEWLYWNPMSIASATEPPPDSTEYPRLAAYSYYRIMLLQFVQGNENEATSTYNTLQEKFGSDPYGHPYAEMASAFWETYQSTNKMYDGCAAAIQYAAEHPEILIPLGSDYHGSQSHTYVPADVCPFR